VIAIQTIGRGAEEDTTKTSHHRGGRRVRSGKNPEQKNSVGKREVLGMIEGVHCRRRHVGR